MIKNSLLALSVLGIGISAYLAYAKLTGSHLVCGTNTGCDIVQNSPYSTLLGIPLGLWGMVYYFSLFFVLFKNINWLQMIAILWGLVFSLYLTSIEAFVLHTFCFWCLGSFFNILVICVIYFSFLKGEGISK